MIVLKNNLKHPWKVSLDHAKYTTFPSPTYNMDYHQQIKIESRFYKTNNCLVLLPASSESGWVVGEEGLGLTWQYLDTIFLTKIMDTSSAN